MNDSEHLRQSDEAAQRRADESDYLARNTRPLCILKMLASDPNLSLDMARVLESEHDRASRARFQP